VYLDAAQIHGIITAAMGCIESSFETLERVPMPSQWNLLTLCHGHPLQDQLPVTSIHPPRPGCTEPFSISYVTYVDEAPSETDTQTFHSL